MSGVLVFCIDGLVAPSRVVVAAVRGPMGYLEFKLIEPPPIVTTAGPWLIRYDESYTIML